MKFLFFPPYGRFLLKATVWRLASAAIELVPLLSSSDLETRGSAGHRVEALLSHTHLPSGSPNLSQLPREGSQIHFWLLLRRLAAAL